MLPSGTLREPVERLYQRAFVLSDVSTAITWSKASEIKLTLPDHLNHQLTNPKPNWWVLLIHCAFSIALLTKDYQPG
jgi:hypothetical protein